MNSIRIFRMQGPGLLRTCSRRGVFPPKPSLSPILKKPSDPLSLIPRRSVATSSTAPQPPKKAAFPQRLLIYHGGTGRTTFVACLKVTTLLTFTFFAFIATPAYLTSGEPVWKAAGVFLCGLVPFAYVAYTTIPFVAFIHIRLPPYAQASREILARFAKNLPPTTPLEITTMNLIGKPRVSTMAVGDLRPATERLGLADYARDAPVRPPGATRPWWAPLTLPPSTRFSVPARPASTREAWVWDEVAAGLARRKAR